MSGLTFGGTDLSSYGLEVLSKFIAPGSVSAPVSATGIPRSSISTESNKVWFWQGESKPIDILFNCHISAASTATLESNISSIESALSGNTDKTLLYPALYADRYWMARWSGDPLEYEYVGGKLAVRTKIRFYAQPYKVGSTPETGSATIGANPHYVYVPNNTGGVVGGTTWTYPEITIKNLTNADIDPDELIVYQVDSPNGALQWQNNLPQGYWLKLDCSARIAYTSNDSGATWTANDWILSLNADWIRFCGAMKNTLLMAGYPTGCTGNMTLSWSYTPRYF